jgi:hypothetical protein
MIEGNSENMENPLEALMEEGESLAVRLNSLGTVLFRTADCQSVNSDIAGFLNRLFNAIPPNDKNQKTGEISGLVHRLTAVSRDRGEMLVAYVLRAITERSRNRIFGLLPGKVCLSDEVAIRPAFGAPMPGRVSHFNA